MTDQTEIRPNCSQCLVEWNEGQRKREHIHHDRPGPHQERLTTGMRAISRVVNDHVMLRWDICASSEVKYYLSDGETAWRPEYRQLKFDDPRFFELTHRDWSRLTMPVWRRPWMKTVVQDGYPVEFRAFVCNGTLQGISSYYPQRPLPKTFQILRWVKQVEIYVKRLLTVIEPPLLLSKSRQQSQLEMAMPEFLRSDDPPRDMSNDVEFTADFLCLETGDGYGVLLLEGGPYQMAHPCCFKPGEIEGVALADRKERPEDVFHV